MRAAPRLSAGLLALCSLCLAIDVNTLKPQGYVSDFAGVVSAPARQQLEAYCAAVEKATGAEMAIVSLPTLQGEPVEMFANDLFRKWGIGKKGKDEGLLLLLVIQDRRSRLEVGFGLEPVVPDGYAGSVLREMRPFLRKNDYGQALLAAAHQLGERIAQAKGVAIPRVSARPQSPDSPAADFPVFPVIAGMLLLFWIAGMGRRGGGGFLPGLILGNMMNRSIFYGGRHRGGGGFGGYDSGDSFGGFGGGDSGGGGASSDW